MGGEYDNIGAMAHAEVAVPHLSLDELGAFGGTGGFIAVDHRGEIALPFNTPGMYRGIAREGRFAVAIFGDETLAM